MQAADIRQVAAGLRAAARPARTVDEVLSSVEPLAEVARRWLSPGDAIRKEALQRLPAPGGVSPFPLPMWEAALDAIFTPITVATLRQFVLNDLAGVASLHAGFPTLIGQVLAGNVPAAAVQSVFCGVLAGSSQLIKPAADDSVFPTLLARSLAAVQPGFAERIAVEYWSGRASADARHNAALAESVDLLVVFGRSEAIAAWRSVANAPRHAGRAPRLLAHGPRTSLELIELPQQPDWPRLADAIALDVAFYDQQGCLSPQQVYLAGTPASSAAFAERLDQALARQADAFPMLPRSLPQRLAVRRVREEALIARLAAFGRDSWLPPGLSGPRDRFAWTILPTAGDALHVGPGLRTLFLTPVASIEQALDAIAPAADAIQGVAVESADFDRLAARLRDRLHIPYVCRPGQLQRPPFGWPNDNIPALRGLLP
jgi:hypothetical protein